MKRSWTRFGVVLLCLMLLTGLMGVPLEAGAKEEPLCFANIAELQEYCAGTYDEWAEVHYNGGSTEFVMDTDLVIPENLRVVVGGQVIIPEGVTVAVSGIIDAESVAVCGTLINDSMVYIGKYVEGVVFTIEESGSYTGYGTLRIWADKMSYNDRWDIVSGLDYDKYEYMNWNSPDHQGVDFTLKNETQFSTFDELKQLAQNTYKTEYKAYYVGTEPLVIEADLTLPKSLTLYARAYSVDYDGNGTVIIPEGVKLTTGNYFYVTELIVDGSFSCWGLSVQETLKVNGKMYVGGYVNLSFDMVEVTGTDKIQYAQVYTKIDWPKRIDIGEEAGKVTGVDEFISTLAEAEANGDPHIQYRIELVLYTDAVIDNSITVPENCNLSIQVFSYSGVFRITENATMTLNGFTEIRCPVKVSGTLVNNSGLDIYCDGWPGSVTIEESGSYKGKGNIFVNSDRMESYEPAIPGIDTSVYEIEKITNDGFYDTAYWALRYPKEISRTYGANRFDTAFVVADQMKANLGIEKFDAVVVASGTNFADALSGSYLSAAKNAPILLSFTTDAINNGVKDYIRENLNEGGTVYILGGESAVPASFETGLDGFTVKRLAGGNRFETNLMILEEAGVGDKPVLVCTGLGFADSLSASAAKLPILLVWNDLTDGQKTLLDNLDGNKLYIIGGESAVSTGMEEQLKAYGETERVAGGNRFETSVAIAETFFSSPKSAVLAYAWNFPDGLCGGPLAATMDAPLILTMDKFEAKAAEYVQNWNIRNGTILGGEGLISEATVNNIFN